MTTANDDIRERVSRMEGLATREDVQTVRTEVAAIQAVIPTLATKEDLYRLETRLIKWMVGSVIAATIAAGSIAGVVTAIIIRFVA